MFNLQPEENQQFSCALMELLDEWGVPPQDQIRLLALPETTRPRQLVKYKHTLCLPETPEVVVRIEHLLGIADALRTSYPMNEHMGTLWLHRPHRRFQKRTPLQCMIEDDLHGLLAVRRHLDCAYDWELDARKNMK